MKKYQIYFFCLYNLIRKNKESMGAGINDPTGSFPRRSLIDRILLQRQRYDEFVWPDCEL